MNRLLIQSRESPPEAKMPRREFIHKSLVLSGGAFVSMFAGSALSVPELTANKMPLMAASGLANGNDEIGANIDPLRNQQRSRRNRNRRDDGESSEPETVVESQPSGGEQGEVAIVDDGGTQPETVVIDPETNAGVDQSLEPVTNTDLTSDMVEELPASGDPSASLADPVEPAVDTNVDAVSSDGAPIDAGVNSDVSATVDQPGAELSGDGTGSVEQPGIEASLPEQPVENVASTNPDIPAEQPMDTQIEAQPESISLDETASEDTVMENSS